MIVQPEMRKLNPDELKAIHTRLKSLHIRYTEVYEEIFDHYCTTLENVAPQDSPASFTNLNTTFTSSVVKKMNKELEKNVSKLVTKMQLETFKFWKHDLRSSMLFFTMVLISVLIALYFGKFILCAWVGLVVVSSLVFMFVKDKGLFNFTFIPWNNGTVNAFNQIIINRLGFLTGVGFYAILNISKIKFDGINHQTEFFDIANIFLLLVLINWNHRV
jgi:hypothetical protein